MFDKIKLKFPNLWLSDKDFDRSLDLIISSFPERNYFVIDSELGFCHYIDQEWKPVLVPNPAEHETGIPFICTHDINLAIHYINSLKVSSKTFFLNLNSFSYELLKPFLFSLSKHNSNYRKAFWSNSSEFLSIQFIAISPDELPEELSQIFQPLEKSYPTLEELYFILSHISSSSTIKVVDEKNFKSICKVGMGLNESDFINYCLISAHKNGEITPEYVKELKMSNIKAHGILEIIEPKITFEDIGGLNNIKDIIHRTSLLRDNPDLTKKYGITPIRRVLIVGVPGTGKSAICQATAAQLNLDLARTGISQVMNSYIGQSEANMRAVFRQINAMTPVCVWIDEFGRDLSGGASSSYVDGGTTDRVHGEFLTGLQELPDDSFLLCAANDIKDLKPEMLRADRFDKIFFAGLPSHNERKHIIRINLSSIETSEEYDYDAIADVTAFMTGAEIVNLIKETKFYISSESFRPITTQDLLTKAPQIRNTIWRKYPDLVKDMYEYALNHWDWASTEQMEDAKMLLHKSKSSRSKVKLG